MGKKTLDKILRFGRSVTPKSQKAIKGWPIRFTEIGKRFSCCFRWIGLSSAQNQSPMRRLKRRSALLQCSGYRFHNFVISLSNANAVLNDRFTREEKLWGSICAGRKRGKNSRILREFTKNYPRDHDCFLSKVPSPFLTRRAIFPCVWPEIGRAH